MPSRSFTSGRKFSTTTSAFSTMRLKAARPFGDFRSRVMLRLLRCRFWKSGPLRGPPGPSPFSRCAGVSILMTFAPQSASWRTQVGPERTRVRSRTVKRERACEARGNGIRWLRNTYFGSETAFRADIPRSVLACPSVGKGRLQPLYSSFRGIRGVWRLEKDIAGCHMTRADEGPGLGFAGRVHEAL